MSLAHITPYRFSCCAAVSGPISVITLCAPTQMRGSVENRLRNRSRERYNYRCRCREACFGFCRFARIGKYSPARSNAEMMIELEQSLILDRSESHFALFFIRRCNCIFSQPVSHFSRIKKENEMTLRTVQYIAENIRVILVEGN